MKRRIYAACVMLLLTWCIRPAEAAVGEESARMIAALEAKVLRLEKQMIEQREEFKAELAQMRGVLQQLRAEKAGGEAAAPQPAEPAADLDASLQQARTQTEPEVMLDDYRSGVGGFVQSLNPDISVIVDTFYHNDDSEEGIHHVLEEMVGFGHSHGDDDHHHSHLEDGLNLRHVELHLSGDVDPYFRAWAIGALSEDSAELEEAVIQTTCLPGGLQVQAGKFFSNFGRINAQHSHEWDFVDQPLVFQLTLGDHGLNEKGVQLSWLAPTPFHLLVGGEAMHGENEQMFHHLDDEQLPREAGPRLWVAWAKCAPNLPDPHGLQLGISAARGVHQEAHDGDADGANDHWLDGHSTFWGVDMVYKYDSPQPYGQGDLVVQGEYIFREKDLSVAQHDLNAALVGCDRIDRQDGYYVHATYGFLPRWRAGMRWEQVGLTNQSRYPDGSSSDFADSHRLTGMLDFTPSEFSRLRVQIGRGTFELDDGDESVWQIFVQWTISLGTHGAHTF